MSYGEHDDAIRRRVIHQQVRKPAEPVTAGAVKKRGPALRVRDDLLLGVVELGQEGRSVSRVTFCIPAMRFPCISKRFGMKLKRRVVHLPRSSGGLEARGLS